MSVVHAGMPGVGAIQRNPGQPYGSLEEYYAAHSLPLCRQEPDSSHYTNGRSITPFDVAADWELDAWSFSAIKYLSRQGRKAPLFGDSRARLDIEDLEKAIDCLRQRIEYLRKRRIDVHA